MAYRVVRWKIMHEMLGGTRMYHNFTHYRQTNSQPWSQGYSNFYDTFFPYEQVQYPEQMGNIAQTPFEYFQKPEQPLNWPNSTPFQPEFYENNVNDSQMQPQQPSMQNNYNGNSSLDLDKVLTTVGQLANTYHQVAPIVQQLNGFLKNFRAGG